MDRSVSDSPVPVSPQGREASEADDPLTRVFGDTAEGSNVQREIEALKAFLARYPLPAPADKAPDDPDAPASLPADEPAASVTASPAEVPPLHLPVTAFRSEERVPFLRSRRGQVIAGVTLTVVLAAVALAGLPFRSAVEDGPRMGTLSVSSSPSGVAVLIDGIPRSVTPLSIDLAPGDHVLEIVTGGEHRRVPITVAAGAQVSHFFELASPPLTVPEAPAPAAAAVPTAGAADSNAAGWISVTAPADVQVHERGRLVGSSRFDRIMLPVGRHELEFVNETLGYRSVQTVQVIAGDIVPVRLRWPQGSVALNAIPWAEVLVDGQSVGETPIGSLSLPIGVHEVVFRHPELGERRASVTVTVGKTTTLGVDLGAK